MGGRSSSLSNRGSNQVAAASIHHSAYDYIMSNGSHQKATNIQFILSAKGLRKQLSQSGVMAVVYKKNSDGNLKEIGRTEVIRNSCNPNWIGNVFTYHQYYFRQPQLVFCVYEVGSKDAGLPANLKLDEQNIIGEASRCLSVIIKECDADLKFPLIQRNAQGDEKSRGDLILCVEETVAAKQSVKMVFRCSKLVNKDLIIPKRGRFLRISRFKEGGNIAIHQTEVVKNEQNLTWNPMCLTTQHFRRKDTHLVIESFASSSSGSHALIGKIETTVGDLEKLHNEKRGMNFLKLSSRNQPKELESQIFVETYTEETLYTFSDYVESLKLEFIVAVDFTTSNGNSDPSHQLNAYQQAISKVGEAIKPFDFDKRFSAWGFGGKPTGGVVSHCFNLNESPGETEVDGVDGILSAYSHALQRITLGDHAAFGEVITKAAEHASNSMPDTHSVLVIITAGILADIQETIDALVGASACPLSIVIVGVGEADFKDMQILDADNGGRLISSTGIEVEHDIVQFVPWCDLQDGHCILEELFAELPEQVLTYMRSKGIKPPLHQLANNIVSARIRKQNLLMRGFNKISQPSSFVRPMVMRLAGAATTIAPYFRWLLPKRRRFSSLT
ncbi:protein BONZAI 1-like isoform X2 [Papaver somniferum]|uniref:protein BONZAI 1-like isoform X2 n=1 Tax=Papaver somniferum TaxID=3469 RepID=UPI000E6FCB7E|nr:protein BONZAI 1-like isoform X2 [Papaver somniferum]